MKRIIEHFEGVDLLSLAVRNDMYHITRKLALTIPHHGIFYQLREPACLIRMDAVTFAAHIGLIESGVVVAPHDPVTRLPSDYKALGMGIERVIFHQRDRQGPFFDEKGILLFIYFAIMAPYKEFIYGIGHAYIICGR